MYRDTIVKNHMLMKRVNKIQNLIAKAYIIIGGASLAAMIISQVLSSNTSDFFQMFVINIFAPAIMISTEILACYKKDNKLALVSMVVSFFSFFAGIIGFFGIIVFVLTIYTNRLYRFLETQEGFPMFHELHEERSKIDHAKEMHEKLERLKSTETSEMLSFETDPVSSEAPTDPPTALDPYANRDKYQRYYEKLNKTSSSDMLDLD